MTPKRGMKHLGTLPLQTSRLALRRFSPADARAMFENWAGDPQVMEPAHIHPHSSVEITRQLLGLWQSQYTQPDCYRWCIDAPACRAAGAIYVFQWEEGDRCSVAYCLCRALWNRGYMTEALGAVADFLLNQVGCSRVECAHAADNPASGRVMEKCGFLRLPRSPECLNTGGLPFNSVQYAKNRQPDY